MFKTQFSKKCFFSGLEVTDDHVFTLSHQGIKESIIPENVNFLSLIVLEKRGHIYFKKKINENIDRPEVTSQTKMYVIKILILFTVYEIFIKIRCTMSEIFELKKLLRKKKNNN